MLGQLSYFCSHCGRQTVHSAFTLRNWFTLFFIPLIPFGKKHQIACNVCGCRLNAVRDLKAQLQDWERTGELKVQQTTAC